MRCPGRGSGQVEVPVGVGGSQCIGVDGEQLAQVVIGDVGEVPVGGVVVGHAGPCDRIFADSSSGGFANARHSAAKRTPARRASVSGRR